MSCPLNRASLRVALASYRGQRDCLGELDYFSLCSQVQLKAMTSHSGMKGQVIYLSGKER